MSGAPVITAAQFIVQMVQIMLVDNQWHWIWCGGLRVTTLSGINNAWFGPNKSLEQLNLVLDK
jgi:hypothetical protein